MQYLGKTSNDVHAVLVIRYMDCTPRIILTSYSSSYYAVQVRILDLFSRARVQDLATSDTTHINP